MLLPHVVGAGREAAFTVAACGTPQRVVGAAALGRDVRRQTHEGWQIDLHVIPPFRRRGIGRALVDFVVAQAAARGAAALHSWDWVEPESDAARAWAALGFSPS